jgi:predicted nucleic acid-binding protein
VILVDSNIPMYLVGGDHPNRARTHAALLAIAAEGERLVTDAEVLQEIIHRYVLTDRTHLLQEALKAVLDLTVEVYPMEREDVVLAAEMVRGTRLSARDAIHVAVMRRRGIERILSFDRGFDGVEGIERIPR